MTESKKAPTRGKKAPADKAPKSAPAKRTRTAKAASANNADVKSMAVRHGEAMAPERGAEAAKPATKAAEASAVLLETVEAIKAVAMKAADPAPAASVEKSASELPATAGRTAVPAARLLEVGTEQAREAYSRAQATTEQLRNAVTETATATTRGALEVNEKVMDALRAQSEATFELWRSALTAGSFTEALRVQTTGMRQVYETTSTHWRDVAETTTRWIGSTMKPLQLGWMASRR